MPIASNAGYLQPVAVHGHHPERAVVRDTAGRWYLWFGDDERTTEVPAEVASWAADQAEMILLDDPLMWFPKDALPTVADCCCCSGHCAEHPYS